jgi:hypothetical protein
MRTPRGSLVVDMRRFYRAAACPALNDRLAKPERAGGHRAA